MLDLIEQYIPYLGWAAFALITILGLLTLLLISGILIYKLAGRSFEAWSGSMTLFEAADALSFFQWIQKREDEAGRQLWQQWKARNRE